MGFSSDNPNTLGNTLQNYAGNHIAGGMFNSLIGDGKKAPTSGMGYDTGQQDLGGMGSITQGSPLYSAPLPATDNSGQSFVDNFISANAKPKTGNSSDLLKLLGII